MTDKKYVKQLLEDYQFEVRFTLLHSTDNKGKQVNHLQKKFNELKESLAMHGVCD